MSLNLDYITYKSCNFEKVTAFRETQLSHFVNGNKTVA